MTGTSAAGILVIMAVVLAGALAMILWIFVVGGRGSFRHRRIEHRAGDVRAGDVRGGIHVGEPGSVMPRRDAPANPFDPDATGPDRPLGILLPGRREGWAAVDRYPVLAAIMLSAVALAIPTFSAIIAHAASAADRR